MNARLLRCSLFERTISSRLVIGREQRRQLQTRSWKDDNNVKAAFSERRASLSPTSSQNGARHLFGFPQISEAQDLAGLAQRTVNRAQLIVLRICSLPQTFADNATTKEEALKITAKQFDRLSDILCGVIDLCEFLRNVHSDPTWVDAANWTYENMCGYMNILNTYTGLHATLKTVLQPFNNETITDNLYAAHQVSLQFLRDFEKSGIHLPEKQRNTFVKLSDQAISLGRQLIQPDEYESNALLTKEEASAVKNRSLLEYSGGKPFLDANSAGAHELLRTSNNSGLRRKIWAAQNSSSSEKVGQLDALLKTRYEIAHLVGKQSWAHVALEDKMISQPDDVDALLASISAKTHLHTAKDVTLMQDIQERETGSREIAPWDRDFLLTQAASKIGRSIAPSLSPFLSLPNVMDGLSQLFNKVFGISFRVAELSSKEFVWHQSVRKVEIVDESQTLLGTMYCDLFARNGKPPSAAHYTVRCARRTDDDDGDLDFAQLSKLEMDQQTVSNTVLPGSTVLPDRQGQWQLPIIVLSCDFERPESLSWHEVETLFHEMGHAIHSMLGQTEYQNVSGTRCATDFVELPSVLMEHFCASPEVLPLFARHHKSDMPLPHATLLQHKKVNDAFKSLEDSNQVCLAAVDQAYHSARVSSPSFDCKEVWYDTLAKFGPPNLFSEKNRQQWSETQTCWPTRFTHLVGYGATYYSYLFDRAIATRIWGTAFQSSGGLSRESGQRYRDLVLRWGGSRDPWQCVGEFLQDEKIARGGSKAAQRVGEWL